MKQIVTLSILILCFGIAWGGASVLEMLNRAPTDGHPGSEEPPTFGTLSPPDVTSPSPFPDPHGSEVAFPKAPDFELLRLSDKKSVKLSSFRGKSPVLLLFGSFT